ncbi:MAG: nucleotidyl transferase AbiEii/AbiGii toxin family protein [Baekduia sp.]
MSDDIAYPSDDQLSDAAADTGIPIDVLIRDTVRLVEIRNLLARGFFASDSVLAGSMALRGFGSPRFTIADADFSTSTEKATPDSSLADLFRYQDTWLDIVPEGAYPNDERATLMKVQPIRFDPAFSAVQLTPGQLRFHADVSFRGLVKPGIELPLVHEHLPGLRLGDESLAVWVMDPAETMAEKILGWCAHGSVKHYVDVAWIATASDMPEFSFSINYQELRNTLGDKLDLMRQLQPGIYADLPSVDAVVGVLGKPPILDQSQWGRLAFLKGREPSQVAVIEAVSQVTRRLRRTQLR